MFRDYFSLWLETFRASPGLEHSHKNDKRFMNLRALGKYLAGLNDFHIDQITPTVVAEVVGGLPAAECTDGNRHRAVRALIQCLNSAEVDGLCVNACRNMLNSSSLISKRFVKPKIKGFPSLSPGELGPKFYGRLDRTILINKYALLTVGLTCLRVGTVCGLKWRWVDFERGSLLKAWRGVCEREGRLGEFVFYSKSSINRPIRQTQLQETVTNALNGEATIHGIRKTAKTWMALAAIPNEVSEHALSHSVGSELERTYNLYDYFEPHLRALSLWDFFLYGQLPEDYRALFNSLDMEEVRKCDELYQEQKTKKYTSTVFRPTLAYRS